MRGTLVFTPDLMLLILILILLQLLSTQYPLLQSFLCLYWLQRLYLQAKTGVLPKMNNKPLKCLFLFFALTCAQQSAKAQANFRKIENYKPYYGWAHHAPQDWMILRQFENEGKTYYLLVNPQTLVTKIDEPGFYQVKPMSIIEARDFFKNTPYQKALRKAEKQSVALQDAGIESGIPKETGISLTADLCPSHRPLARRIFTDIFTEFQKVERPVPVALSVTGVWMRQHPQDLEWLKQMQAKREIYITWINHSFNHRVSMKA